MHHRSSRGSRGHGPHLGRLSEAFFLDSGISRQAVECAFAGFQGELVFPGSAGYDAARMLSNPRFDLHPVLIAYCVAESDVRACLRFARITALPFRVRAGGHSGAGYSAMTGGIVIDLSRLNDISVDRGQRTVTVGAGARFAKINEVLERYQAHVPGGECGDVAVGGYVQGGGYGLTSRTFGMNCDNVLAVRVMLADGTVVEASPARNHDLWWAVRGGAGNNFGVLLGVTYRLHRLATVYGWRFHWRLTSAADRQLAANALVAIQTSFVDAPPQFNIQVSVQYRQMDGAGGGAEPQLWVFGMYAGSAQQGAAALAGIRALPGAVPDFEREGAYTSILDALLHPWPYFPGAGELCDHTASRYVASGSIARWTSECWQRVLDSLVRPLEQQWSYFWLEVYGGAINGYPLEQSAFVHRGVLFNACLDVFWNRQDELNGTGRFTESQRFQSEWTGLLGATWNGRIYQNYPEDMPPGVDYAVAYWGQALPALIAVKKKYDPDRRFDFPQAIPDRATAPAVWPGEVVRSLNRPIEPDDRLDIWSDGASS